VPSWTRGRKCYVHVGGGDGDFDGDVGRAGLIRRGQRGADGRCGGGRCRVAVLVDEFGGLQSGPDGLRVVGGEGCGEREGTQAAGVERRNRGRDDARGDAAAEQELARVARGLDSGGAQRVVIRGEREELRHLRGDGEGVDSGRKEDHGALHGPGGCGAGEEVGEAGGGVGAGAASGEENRLARGDGAEAHKAVDGGGVVERVKVVGKNGGGGPGAGRAVDAVEGSDTVPGGDQFAGEKQLVGPLEPFG